MEASKKGDTYNDVINKLWLIIGRKGRNTMPAKKKQKGPAKKQFAEMEKEAEAWQLVALML